MTNRRKQKSARIKSNGFKFNHSKSKVNEALGISEAEYDSIHNKSNRIASAPFFFSEYIRRPSEHIEWAFKNENIENLSSSIAYLVGFFAGERFSLLQMAIKSISADKTDFESFDMETDGNMFIAN